MYFAHKRQTLIASKPPLICCYGVRGGGGVVTGDLRRGVRSTRLALIQAAKVAASLAKVLRITGSSWGLMRSNCLLRFSLKAISSLFLIIGGAEGDRTPDLMTASHALSQLSYGPFADLARLLAADEESNAAWESASSGSHGFAARGEEGQADADDEHDKAGDNPQ
jgi:hypothetical protein